MTQRSCKVPILYRDKLNALLTEIDKHNIIKQIGTHSNPLIIIPK